MDLFASPLAAIQQRLKNQLRSPVPLLQKLVNYAFEKPGKNIRSRLMIALCYDHGFDPLCPEVQNIAAAIELIHSATLFHDDVIDASAQRRHRPTVPVAYSNTCSILLGDYCFSKSYLLLKELPGKDRFFEQISQTAQDLIEGEVWQYQLQGQELSLEQYYHIIELKTARLFELVTSSLCLLSEETFTPSLRTLGKDFGILFQLLDDHFDYFRGHEQDGSKPAGKDFEEKKMTLPVILALQQGLLGSAEEFFDQGACFEEFLIKISEAESACQEIITRHYQQICDLECCGPQTRFVLQQAAAAFIPSMAL